LYRSRKVIVSARVWFNTATLSARAFRASAMRMSANSLNACTGAARRAPPGMSFDSEEGAILLLLPLGEISNAMNNSFDGCRSLNRVNEGWRGPISESFRFAWLGFRLKHTGLLI
jgi:hypothetical protein